MTWQSKQQQKHKPTERETTMSELKHFIDAADAKDCRTFLGKVLDGALNPAFGSQSKRELELLIFETLIDVGFLPKEPTVYEVMKRLRITRGRARALLFDRDVRRYDETTLDLLAKQALRRPILQGQGYAVVLDIENPLLADHLREMLRKMGHATDGSFSPSLVKINDDAAAALVDKYIDEADKKNVLKALHQAGVEDKTIKGVIKKLIRSSANKLAGEAGEMISEKFGKLLEAVFEAKFTSITEATIAYKEQACAGGTKGAD